MSFKEVYMTIPLAQRYAIIKEVHSKLGNNVTKTSNFLGICYNTVNKAIKTEEVHERVYTEKLTNEHKIFIYMKTLQNPVITGEELADLIFNLFGTQVSDTTVNRCRNKIALHYRPPLRSVFLTPNAIALRKSFAQNHLNSNWQNVVFSDESSFQLGQHKKWVWVDKFNITDKVLSHDRKYYPHIMIWGAVGYSFKSDLIVFEGHVNSEKYIDQVFLESNLIEKADERWGIEGWVFHQDNAPSHTSKVTKAVLSELAVKVLADWPPYSPDLNIIEVVWAIMKSRIEKKNPTTIDELKKIIFEVWDGLTFQTINGLIDTMNERIRFAFEHPERSYYHSY